MYWGWSAFSIVCSRWYVWSIRQLQAMFELCSSVNGDQCDFIVLVYDCPLSLSPFVCVCVCLQ